jgi:hypothetical protein
MIELLRIHTLVSTVRALIFIGDAADKFGNACYRKAIKLEVFAWRQARAEKLAGPEG